MLAHIRVLAPTSAPLQLPHPRMRGIAPANIQVLSSWVCCIMPGSFRPPATPWMLDGYTHVFGDMVELILSASCG